MGYVMVTSGCGTCGRIFSYNPNRVPSFTFKPERGREPICADCMELINTKRKEVGKDPHPILPGAYEMCDENEVEWGEG